MNERRREIEQEEERVKGCEVATHTNKRTVRSCERHTHQNRRRNGEGGREREREFKNSASGGECRRRCKEQHPHSYLLHVHVCVPQDESSGGAGQLLCQLPVAADVPPPVLEVGEEDGGHHLLGLDEEWLVLRDGLEEGEGVVCVPPRQGQVCVGNGDPVVRGGGGGGGGRGGGGGGRGGEGEREGRER